MGAIHPWFQIIHESLQGRGLRCLRMDGQRYACDKFTHGFPIVRQRDFFRRSPEVWLAGGEYMVEGILADGAVFVVMRTDGFRLLVEMRRILHMAVQMADIMLLDIQFMPEWDGHVEETDIQHEKAAQPCLPACHG